jgi:uncharacterized protein YbjT (DUF2867 family)
MAPRNVFITGGTGYLGRRLASQLLQRGHTVRALVRRGSEDRLPEECEAVFGDALRATTFADLVAPSETFVQLVGVSKPSPSKAAQFRAIDLESVRASVPVASNAGIRHFVYVSVAHPAPVMQAYIAVREQGENLIRDAGLDATILRPWYVLGPGHRWPYLLLPIYALFERVPSTRESAMRLGLVTIDQMVTALVQAVENPANGIRIVEVPEIRSQGRR